MNQKFSGDLLKEFLKVVTLVKQNATKNIIFDCSDLDILRTGLEIVNQNRPAIFLRNQLTNEVIELAKSFNTSLIITSDSFENMIEQTEQAQSAGINDIILNLTSKNIRQSRTLQGAYL